MILRAGSGANHPDGFGTSSARHLRELRPEADCLGQRGPGRLGEECLKGWAQGQPVVCGVRRLYHLEYSVRTCRYGLFESSFSSQFTTQTTGGLSRMLSQHMSAPIPLTTRTISTVSWHLRCRECREHRASSSMSHCSAQAHVANLRSNRKKDFGLQKERLLTEFLR